MSGIMLRHFTNNADPNQSGTLNTLLIPFILVILLFIGAASFAGWAFSSRQDYKNNTDQKISVAVTAATQKQTVTDAANYAQEEKNPLNTYSGPSEYGSLSIQYPKTWSAYVAVAPQAGGSIPINAYFQPGVVPNIEDPASLFDLRVEVIQQAYSSIVSNFNALAQQNKVTVTPYSLPKVASVIGVRVDGTIESNKQGSMVILPLRANTLEIYTESTADESDFNGIILPNFSFSP